MFNVEDKVQFEVENKLLIGTIVSIQVNPATGLVHYIVDRKNGDSYTFLEEDLTPYNHTHIPKGFCK